ncbi:MAG: hypothetical protein M3440_11340 [Chloroflexota bacterium]|nr:hypothetical protein [Chloroflexota bacterium]
MNVHERQPQPQPQPLRQVIDQEQSHLRASVPPDREAAILALLRIRDRLQDEPGIEPLADLVTGRRLADLGGNTALQLCLESTGDSTTVAPVLSLEWWDGWAERFLQECGRLTEAELVLNHFETGFMRMVEDGNGAFNAWIATKRPPTSWGERDDFDWWASLLAMRHAPELHSLRSRQAAMGGDPGHDALYRRLASVHLEMMAYQLSYPLDATIGGCTVQTYRDVLRWLIEWALQGRDRGEAAVPRSERSLVAAIASGLAVDPTVIVQAVAAFTLDRENAAYHAAVPGVATAPIVRVDESRLVPSFHGLTSEPLLFLTRELKRRDAQDYHNSAYLREAVFREDLYTLFQDKRFVTSAGRIQLRRERGDIRTDIDAVVFDRKTGTLGVFELKSQDAFARSTAELARQRDNVLYANRQVSGVLAWLQRHGAAEILNRVDTRTAKTFRVQKVYPFVLGRYLVHFNDGPAPDRRAAWSTWPQLLRLLDERAMRASDANPIASLFARLSRQTNDAPLIGPLAEGSAQEIAIGASRVTIYPSWVAYKGKAAVDVAARRGQVSVGET